MITDRIAELKSLPEFLTSNILGQEQPLYEISALIQRSFCGLRFPGTPGLLDAFSRPDRDR